MVGFIMKFTNSLVQIACNKMLSIHGGDLYVGVMTVINAIRDVFTLPASGITDGARPVLSYNYGAGQMQRASGRGFASCPPRRWSTRSARGCLRCSSRGCSAGSSRRTRRWSRPACGCCACIFAGFFFRASSSAARAFFSRWAGRNMPSRFPCCAKVVIVVPLTLLLPVVGLGTTGVFLAEPISNIVGGLACYITMLCTAYKQMGRE